MKLTLFSSVSNRPLRIKPRKSVNHMNNNYSYLNISLRGIYLTVNPAHMNNKAPIKAWIKSWKMASLQFRKNRIVIIKPICMYVLKTKTPPLTKFKEWTKDDTRVEASIPTGGQEEKGIWAPFVIQVKIAGNKGNYCCFNFGIWWCRKSLLFFIEIAIFHLYSKTFLING